MHDVLVVAPVQLLGPQRGLQLMHQVLGHHVVEVLHAQHPLDRMHALLEGRDRALLLVHLVVDVAPEAAGDPREAGVQAGGVGNLAADDQRGAGLVDEDRVDLVHDAVVVAALHLLGTRHGHVVAQVVEAQLVVCAVGDVAAVLAPLVLPPVAAGHDQPHGESEPLVEPAHPLCVAAGQIVVDRHHVDAPAGESGEVDRKSGSECLALSGAHLRHRAPVQRRAAHELHVEMALAEHPHRCLPHHRERLQKQIVGGLAPLQPAAELAGAGPQAVVVEALHLPLERVDVGDEGLQVPELASLA